MTITQIRKFTSEQSSQRKEGAATSRDGEESGRSRSGGKVKSSPKWRQVRGVGYPSLPFKGEAQAGEAAGFEIVLRDQQGIKRALRTELWC